MDSDGSFYYSPVVKVAAVPANGTISVYPNPVVDQTIHIYFDDQKDGAYQLLLVNAGGQLIQSDKVNINQRHFVHSMTPGKKIIPGNYQLVIINGAIKKIIAIQL